MARTRSSTKASTRKRQHGETQQTDEPATPPRKAPKKARKQSRLATEHDADKTIAKVDAAPEKPTRPAIQAASNEGCPPPRDIKDAKVSVNRAPVLTAWIAQVAKRQGYTENAALTFGKYVSGLLAHSKGVNLGIYEERERDQEGKRSKEKEAGVETLHAAGFSIKAKHVNGDVRALDGGDPHKAADPKKTEQYLKRAFGDQYDDVLYALCVLAHSLPPDELDKQAYHLYEQIRPNVPAGERGWGHHGVLDLHRVLELAESLKT
jgi:hypothetical protein